MSNGNRNGPSRPSSSSSHFLAGLGSGILSAVLLQPADLLKTRVQQSRSTSLWTVIREISRSPLPFQELWRGTLPSTLRTGMGSALYFSTLNALRQHVSKSHLLLQPLPTASTHSSPSSSSSSSSSSLPRLSNLANLTTGAIARGSVGFIMMPITVLKVRFESNLYAYKSLWGACQAIWMKEGGLRGFFAGFGATAVRDAPYAGLYVLFYEGSKKRLSSFVTLRYQHSTMTNSVAVPAGEVSKTPMVLATTAAEKTIEAAAAVAASAASKAISSPSSILTSNNNNNNNNSPQKQGNNTEEKLLKGSQSATINFLSGMMAASLATALTNPFDAIKTRLQIFPKEYRNMYHALMKMVKQDGVRSLFDGLALRMARKAMSSALAWTVYEEVIRRVEKRGGWRL
ncbi:MAG: hypothetical protein M1823_000755 [Watsoniomyces obsoletus]|nr:MAG: hypothetical protein M1823_000755 [Watsoniomyces obsoletus]